MQCRWVKAVFRQSLGRISKIVWVCRLGARPSTVGILRLEGGGAVVVCMAKPRGGIARALLVIEELQLLLLPRLGLLFHHLEQRGSDRDTREDNPVCSIC